MATSTYELSRSPARVGAPQLGVGTIVWMFAWPAVWYTLLIYVFGRAFIPDGGTTPTWFRLLVIVLGSGAELAAGLVLLRREGYRMSIDALRDRLRIRWPKGLKAWALAVIVLILGMGLSMAMEPLNSRLASMPGFAPPAWWGAANNPTVQVKGAADFFPDVNLVGNYSFVILYFVLAIQPTRDLHCAGRSRLPDDGCSLPVRCRRLRPAGEAWAHNPAHLRRELGFGSWSAHSPCSDLWIRPRVPL